MNMNPKRASSHARLTKVAFVVCLIVILMLTLSGCATGQSEMITIDHRAVNQLFDLLKTLKQQNPDYLEVRAQLASMPDTIRMRFVDSLIQKNMSNDLVRKQIQKLLGTDAYRLYYLQFRNMTPETHARIFCALPYAIIQSPADISRTLYDLCDHLDDVEDWYARATAGVDLQAASIRAQEFLPEGEYKVPPVHFIYDGNGDAFAREGEVCFDIYGIILAKEPPGTVYAQLDALLDNNAIQPVLAHELHHIFARGYYNNAFAGVYLNWQDRQKTTLNRRMVSEGTALQCNPYDEFERGIKEDSATVVYWIAQLNEKLHLLKNGGITEDDYSNWYSESYHAQAHQLLKDYLHRTAPPEQVDSLIRRYQSKRPSMVYTLGWWMVRHISNNGADKASIIELVRDPKSLYEKYNQSVADLPAVYHVEL